MLRSLTLDYSMRAPFPSCTGRPVPASVLYMRHYAAWWYRKRVERSGKTLDVEATVGVATHLGVLLLGVTLAGCATTAAAGVCSGESLSPVDRAQALHLLTYNVAGLPDAFSGSHPSVNHPILSAKLDDQTAVFMITNPNTLGLFETQIEDIAARVHAAGGLVYIDGANMNAIMGVTRPGDFGGDMMHYNVHKTFTGPHGGGGPGAGPIAVREDLAEFLPGPIVTRTTDENGQPRFELTTPDRSIGRVRSHFGNVGILLRGYCYLRTLGRDGVREVARHAV